MDKPLQTPFQATLLKIHGVVVKVENVILFPFRWLARQVDQTEVFVERDQPHLKVVK